VCNDDAVCVAGPAIGEACTFGACGVGATCDDNDVCVALRAVGEPCNGSRQCAGDAVCSFDQPDHVDVCVSTTRVGLNEDCSTNLCDDALVCSAVDGAQVCRVLVVGQAAGDACTVGSVVSCPLLHGCVDGACQAVVGVETGACVTSGDAGAVCVGGFFGDRVCDDVDGDGEGLCADAPAVGESCPNFRCARGAHCTYNDNDEAVCVADAVAGERCDEFGCALGLFCESAVCVTRAASSQGVADDECFE
jgi:hypothetical protein